MKIAVLTSSYPRYPGDGTAPFIQSICQALADDGNEVAVIAPYDIAVQREHSQKISVHRFQYIWPKSWHIMGHGRALEADVRLRPLSYLLLPLYLISALFALLRLTYNQRSQIIHVHWVIPNGLIAAWVASMRGIPFVVSLHGSDIYVAQRNRLFGAVARYVFRRASAVTACSPELKQGAISLGAPDNTFLLPYGADPNLFIPNQITHDYRSHLGIPLDAIVISTIGRFVYKKGFNILIEAFSEVIKVEPKIHLVLAGDGPLKSLFIQQCQQLNISNKVSLPGRIPWDQVPELLTNTDIFVVPSVRDEHGNVDGLPNVVLEAMSCALPVIASDIGGISLVIKPDESGSLIPPGDVEALKTALLELIKDGKKAIELGKNARNLIVQQFNWGEVAHTLVDTFRLAIWQHSHHLRLGSIYRDEMLRQLGWRPVSGRVLDVGSHDGFWLSTLVGCEVIGVDIGPEDPAPGIPMVRADGCYLPFKPGSFDYVYIMDVIEHVAEDAKLAVSLTQVIAPGGILILSTPSINIKMVPGFSTKWISHQWGHHLRFGYTKERLETLFQTNLDITLQTWNAPAFRILYLPVRLMSIIMPRFSNHLFRRLAIWDSSHQNGDHGFLIMKAKKPQIDTVSTSEFTP